jgi:hypothetical protein
MKSIKKMETMSKMEKKLLEIQNRADNIKKKLEKS